MSLHWLELHGHTHDERHLVTARVADALSRAGAFVTDVHLFSNISTCLNIELARRHLRELERELHATGLVLDAESHGRIAELASAGSPDDEIVGTLQLTFVHQEPDLRRPVPKVPG